MNTTTVSGKGQVTLPAALIRERRLKPGTQLYVVANHDSIVLTPVEGSLSKRLASSTHGLYGDANNYVEQERSQWT
ncbi:MAG: AbrB/MazE/SpoVT family DNA-binding domain-containing protein [Acidimicrobiales bacterium]